MGHQATYVTYFRIGVASDAALRELADAQITLMGRGHCSVSAVYRFPLYGGSTWIRIHVSALCRHLSLYNLGYYTTDATLAEVVQVQ